MAYGRCVVEDLVAADGKILPSGVVSRLIGHVQTGLRVSSTFSGMGGDVVGTPSVVIALQECDMLDIEPTFVFDEACDKNQSCQACLESFVPSLRPRHIRMDLEGRLPQHVRACLDSVCPTLDSDPNTIRGSV